MQHREFTLWAIEYMDGERDIVFETKPHHIPIAKNTFQVPVIETQQELLDAIANGTIELKQVLLGTNQRVAMDKIHEIRQMLWRDYVRK